ncbi:hypothetical protein G6F37_006781 [Rhizopus arrhizus]|nr:hypothetical protein G6F38_011537 [Rhizopus arrhizus]KAG1157351.1 hypothetical protein G6F37_006781 [Rhizopus arrhizus]
MSLCSSEQEIQLTSTSIFEGHLYIRTEKKKWKWRLFRFDGTSFTCLSPKKYPYNPNVTNPLYTTPKKKLIDEPPIKHYQLPEWTVDIVSIASISLLRKAKRPPICFSIQTIFNERFVLKAGKQKDLERWLFVLTKMWKFTQDQQILVCQQQQQEQEHYFYDKPLALLSNEKIQVIEEWRKSLTELMAYDSNIKRTPPPIEPIPEDDNLSIFTDMTSISRRRIKKVRRSSKRSTKIMPLLDETSNLKRRRSDDVRHWIGNTKPQTENKLLLDEKSKPRYQSYMREKKSVQKKIPEQKRMSVVLTEEEDEEISLAELLHRLNITEQQQASLRHCSTFVTPLIAPYTFRQPF